MPLVQIKSLQGFLSAEKKQEIIKRVTEALISVEGEAVRPFTWVIIDEVSMES
ncbi:MAG: tautomerase family protein [Blastocatellia bacterium]|nr:tautomerase family protein [Blastocatellia bacterium]